MSKYIDKIAWKFKGQPEAAITFFLVFKITLYFIPYKVFTLMQK